MGYLAVLLAAVASFAFGALWYGLLSGPWKEASGVTLDADGNPVNAKSPTPYVTSFVAMIVVAGFLRHTLVAVDADSFLNSVRWGAGVGLFFITPWITLNNGYSTRPQPFRLAMIDGGYATIGCAIMGAVLWLLSPAVA